MLAMATFVDSFGSNAGCIICLVGASVTEVGRDVKLTRTGEDEVPIDGDGAITAVSSNTDTLSIPDSTQSSASTRSNSPLSNSPT
jgi:hypothetical protein